jgi:signal transduction histidine kinase
MNAQAGIVPVVEVSSHRASVGRMVVVAGAYVAIVLGGAIYPLVSPLRDFWNAPVKPLEQLSNALTAGLWLAVLLVSMARQPRGRLWKLIFLAFATQQIGALEYVPNSLVWSVARVIDVIGLAVFVHLLVAYPSGYLRNRFDRLVIGWAYIVVTAWTLVQLFFVGDWWQLLCDPDCVHNLLVIWPNPELYEFLRNAITTIGVVTVFPLVVVALSRHWRTAGVAARRTLLPLIVAVPLWLVLLTTNILSDELDFKPGIDFYASPSGTVVQFVLPLVLPAGLLLGILRTRWSRGRIASLVVELGRGVPIGGLRDILARTLGDPTLQLAFAAPSGTGFVDGSGQPVEVPVSDSSRTVTRLERGGELLGVLIHDPAIDAEDPGLVDAVGNAAWLALENERLAAEVRAQLEEVRASRARIVEAADAERRRVERDLHDGAQQRLVALALRLQLAKESSPGSGALLDEATTELETAIGEVRGLARGLHPTILTEAGLAAAVETLAERTPMVVTVEIPDTRFPPQVEAAAYFVVAEALTNVARYAEASEARVAAEAADGRLIVTVSDDGRGGANPSAGSGLRGLADRMAAAGGSLIVTSRPGAGTTVRAEIPLDTAPAVEASDQAPVEAVGAAAGFARAASTASSAAQSMSPRTRRTRMLSNPGVLIAGVATVIAVAALVAARLGAQDAPTTRVDQTFARPFAFTVPLGTGIELYPGPLSTGDQLLSDRLHVFSAYRGSGEGITVWIVDGVQSDVCAESRVVPRPPGREGLLAYLRSIVRLHVSPDTPTTVDGRPATQVDLTVEGGDSRCPDHALFPWRDAATGQPIWISDISWVQLVVVDVAEATVVFEIWNQADLTPWLPTAHRVIDSIRFFNAPSGGSLPGVSPSPS